MNIYKEGPVMKKILSVVMMVVLASAVLFANGNKEMESTSRLDKIFDRGQDYICSLSRLRTI